MEQHKEELPQGAITRRGIILKEAREAKGLSLETIHEVCKIPMDVLHAIEEGYTVRMVSTYYFKGFIKMYAKYLGVDPHLVLDEPLKGKNLVEDRPAPQVEKVNPKYEAFLSRQSHKQWVLKVLVGIVGIGLIIVLGIFIKGAMAKMSAQDIKFPKIQLPKKTVPAAVVVEKKEPEKKVKNKAKTEDHRLTRAAIPEIAPRPAGMSETKKPAEKETKKVASSKKVSLTVRAKVTGWLQVKVDGEVVFQSTMREGTAESWQANEQIEISGKNINNLDFEVNGKVFGQLGKAERGARRVVITSEGLSVKK